MAYHLNEKQLIALKAFCYKYECKLQLSKLPIVYLKDKRGIEFCQNIDQIVLLYENFEKV